MTIHNMKYLNVPEEVEEQLKSLTPFVYEPYYRAIRHTRDLKPADFYPSHVDEASKKSKESMEQKGGFCSFVANLPINNLNCDDYSMSLFYSKDRILSKFEKHRNIFPVIAEGTIKKDKGDVFLMPKRSDKQHCSCYIFDYLQNNPYTEFKPIREEKHEK